MKMKVTLLTILSLFLIVYLQAQEVENLEFVPPETVVAWPVFELEISKSQERKILASYGKKIEIRDFVWLCYGELLDVKKCNTRGNNTLKFRRKSFQVAFNEPAEIEGVLMVKMAINNLAMDKNYWRNRFAFILLDQLDLFPLYNTFSEVKINGNTQGVYLLVHKAESYASLVLESPLLVRRGTNSAYKVDISTSDLDKARLKALRQIPKICRLYKGEALYDSLNSILDMEKYYRWLAFNFIVLNGDYTDEVYAYYDEGTQKFGIIPWDYDDIFAPSPHEGWQERNMKMKNKLIFSSEAAFDVYIDKDPVLYSRYLNAFENVLSEISTKDLMRTFKQIYQELYGFLKIEPIVEQSAYDLEGPTSITKLEADLKIHYNFLVQRMISLNKMLEEEKANFSQL